MTCYGCGAPRELDLRASPRPPCPGCGETTVKVHKQVEGAVEVSGEVGILSRTHLFLTWTELAIDHEKTARAAREGADFAAEFRAALQAITTAALGIDAFYGGARTFVPIPPETEASWERNRIARQRRILETLKLGFELGAAGHRWIAELDAL